MSSLSFKNVPAKDRYNEIVEFKEGKYASIKIGEDKWKWKKMTEDQIDNMVNAIKTFKFWNYFNIKNNLVEIKIDLKSINQFIKLVEKELISICKKEKIDTVELYYLKNQGKWYDGEMHFVDYLWDDTVELVEKKHSDWTKVNFLMTDDVYVLNCMLKDTLIFQHNLSKDGIKLVTNVLKICMEKFNDKDYKNKIKEIKKFNSNKSIEIVFE
mgnify:FL=1